MIPPPGFVVVDAVASGCVPFAACRIFFSGAFGVGAPPSATKAAHSARDRLAPNVNVFQLIPSFAFPSISASVIASPTVFSQ